MAVLDPVYLLKYAPILDSSTYKVFVVLLSIYSLSDNELTTSLSDLKLKTSLSVSTVRRSLDSLEALGILETSYTIGVSKKYKLVFGE